MACLSAVLTFHEHLLSCRQQPANFSQSSTHKNVRANLADVLGQAVAVQVVVLHLEVLAEGDEDGEGELVSSLVGDASLRC